MLDKEQLREQLKKSVIDITFTDFDGTKKTLKTTLMDEYFPISTFKEEFKPGYKPIIKENPIPTVTIWDIGNSTWYPIRIESIISTEVID